MLEIVTTTYVGPLYEALQLTRPHWSGKLYQRIFSFVSSTWSALLLV